MTSTSTATIAVAFILMTLSGECFAALKINFYIGKCKKNNVEKVVFDVVKAKFAKDPTLAAALLRMQFHDFFVRGCDASLLLDGRNTEKTAGSNGSVRGYEVIDAVKATLQKLCPGVVSCADIIAIATRAAVFLLHRFLCLYSRGGWYNVETGRRDGTVSIASDASNTLPGPSIPVSASIQTFAAKGISKEDFILLLGADTVGIAHCGNFQNRPYSFNGVSGRTDLSMNPALASSLKRTCPRSGDGSNSAFLDQSSTKSVNVVDNGFFKAINARKGVLQIDQQIARDGSTKAIVTKYAANNFLFKMKFGQAMVKMGRMGILTGSQGQIRKSCRSVKK